MKPKTTLLAFAKDVIFDGEEASDIGDSNIVLITITKKSQLFDINTKNKNKKKKKIKSADVIIKILVNFAYIFIVIKAACQFLKHVLILAELIKQKKEMLNKVVSFAQHVMISVILLPDII